MFKAIQCAKVKLLIDFLICIFHIGSEQPTHLFLLVMLQDANLVAIPVTGQPLADQHFESFLIQR